MENQQQTTNTNSKATRIEFIDALKSLAIFFVLWGHSIQYLKNNDDFVQNSIWGFIYSVHMPLFFFISGFFFKSSLKYGFVAFFKRKFFQLLIPCLSWSIIFAAVDLIECLQKPNFDIDFLHFVKSALLPSHWPFWFFKHLFMSYVLSYIIFRILKNNWAGCVIALAIVMFSPVGSEIQRFLFPMFWVGIFFKENYEIFQKKIMNNIYCIAAFTVYAISLYFWNGSYTIYFTPFPPLFDFSNLQFNVTKLPISIFRFFIGALGSICFFGIIYRLPLHLRIMQFAKKVGVHTMAIYILQVTLLEMLLNNCLDFSRNNIWIFNLFITPLISLLVLATCISIISVIGNSKMINLLFFGVSVLNDHQRLRESSSYISRSGFTVSDNRK